MTTQAPEGYVFGENVRDGETHEEWHWKCDPETGYGCAYHAVSFTDPEKGPHVHRCALHPEVPDGVTVGPTDKR